MAGGCRPGGARRGALPVHRVSRGTGRAFVLLLWVLTLVAGGSAYVGQDEARRPVAALVCRWPELRLRGGGGPKVGTNGAGPGSPSARTPVQVKQAEGVKGADTVVVEGEVTGDTGAEVAERILDVDEVAGPCFTRPAPVCPT